MAAPDNLIASLDRALAGAGDTIKLRRRGVAGLDDDVTCSAGVRSHESKPEPDGLVGAVTQQDFFVIVSPTPLVTWGVPTTDDFAVIGGTERKIDAVMPIRVAGAVVRYELKVRGGNP